MEVFRFLLTVIPALALLLLLARSWLEPDRTTPSLWLCLAVLLLSGFLLASIVRTIPGGPFISIHGDILPVMASIVTLVSVVSGIRTVSIVRRGTLFFFGIASIAIFVIVVIDITTFWRDRYARGALFGW